MDAAAAGYESERRGLGVKFLDEVDYFPSSFLNAGCPMQVV